MQTLTKSMLLASALKAARASLSARPAALVAIALAAGMAAPAAHAWGTNYEYAGSSIGYQLGNALGAGSSVKSSIGSTIGNVIGSTMGRSVDQSSQQEKAQETAIQQAKLQAQRDAAYDAERRRLDPNYTYSAAAGRSASANSTYTSNLDAIVQRNSALAAQYTSRSGQRSR